MVDFRLIGTNAVEFRPAIRATARQVMPDAAGHARQGLPIGANSSNWIRVNSLINFDRHSWHASCD